MMCEGFALLVSFDEVLFKENNSHHSNIGNPDGYCKMEIVLDTTQPNGLRIQADENTDEMVENIWKKKGYMTKRGLISKKIIRKCEEWLSTHELIVWKHLAIERDGSTFKGKQRQCYSTFTDQYQSYSTFEGDQYQSYSMFEGDQYQINSTFRDQYQNSSTFRNQSQSDSTFKGNQIQSGSTFKGNQIQSGSTFEGDQIQIYSTFKGNQIQSGSMFKGKMFIHDIIFSKDKKVTKLIHEASKEIQERGEDLDFVTFIKWLQKKR